MAKHNKTRSFEKICATCGVAFLTGSSIKIHCTPECRIRHAAKPFNGLDCCWEWSGSINPQTGYGQLSSWVNGKRILLTAHRVSYRAFHGPIPEGMEVCHKCDNRRCFNPLHLFSGSQLDNMQDMIAKGRDSGSRGTSNRPFGESHHRSKLTNSAVIAIRESSETLSALGERYGVAFGVISAAKNRKTWKHIL